MTMDKGGFESGQKLDQIYGNRENRGLSELLQGRKENRISQRGINRRRPG